jgi:hypothetical protein
MGYHIILNCSAKIKPEYMDFIQKEYMYKVYDNEDLEDTIPEQFRDLYRTWRDLYITTEDCHNFHEYTLEGDIFSFRIEKKPYRHGHWRDLENDYRCCMKYVIAPMSSEILNCVIEHDDFGFQPHDYTDEEIRNLWVKKN